MLHGLQGLASLPTGKTKANRKTQLRDTHEFTDVQCNIRSIKTHWALEKRPLPVTKTTLCLNYCKSDEDNKKAIFLYKWSFGSFFMMVLGKVGKWLCVWQGKKRKMLQNTEQVIVWAYRKNCFFCQHIFFIFDDTIVHWLFWVFFFLLEWTWVSVKLIIKCMKAMAIEPLLYVNKIFLAIANLSDLSQCRWRHFNFRAKHYYHFWSTD